MAGKDKRLCDNIFMVIKKNARKDLSKIKKCLSYFYRVGLIKRKNHPHVKMAGCLRKSPRVFDFEAF